MADEVEVVAPATAATPEAEKPPSHREVLERRFDAFVKTQSEGATPEAPAETPAAEVPPKAEAKPDAAMSEQETPPPEVPAKIEVTPDQLKDTAYWGSLDAEGWKRMERDYPVATAHVKAGQAAASRFVTEARKTAPPPQERPDETPSDEPSQELIDAVAMSQDLDPKTAAKGHLLVARLTASTVAKEIGVDPARSKAQSLAEAAYASALTQMPELATYDMQKLAAIVEADPALKYLVEQVGTAEAIVTAMLSSGKTFKAQMAAAAVAKTAADAQAEAEKKKNANLKVVQSNARPATSDLVNGKGAPPAKLSAWEKKSQRFDEEVARQGGKGN